MKPIEEIERIACSISDPTPLVNEIIDTVNELVRRVNSYHTHGVAMPGDNAEAVPEGKHGEHMTVKDECSFVLPRRASLTYLQIAEVCYAANRALCQMYGEESPAEWDEAPDWQRDTVLTGVIAIDEGKVRTAGDSHISWAAHKIENGWKWGEVKDPAAKTHPCLVPFHELPYDQRLKDHLFLAVATALLRN